MSQGKMIKSCVIASWTSANLKISAVPEVKVKSSGAIISGFGLGRLVRYGFVSSADCMASLDSGGVISVIPIQIMSALFPNWKTDTTDL